MLSTPVRSCAQIRLTTHLFSSFQSLTLSKVHAHVSSAAQTDRCTHPALRQVVSTWTRCGGRLAPRRANERYTAEPTTLTRLVCQAYHRHPGRTTCRPPCLDSLTPDAHRAGPLHPRPRWCASRQGEMAEHTIAGQAPFPLCSSFPASLVAVALLFPVASRFFMR